MSEQRISDAIERLNAFLPEEPRKDLQAIIAALAAVTKERDGIIAEHKFLNDLKNERTAERDAAIARAERAEATLAKIRAVFAMTPAEVAAEIRARKESPR